jgi:thermitase
VNVSLGARLPCQAERDVIDAAPDVLFVVAALNDGVDVDAKPIYPCAYPSPNIVCVAASDQSDGLAGFSNYGSRSVDLAAPGVSVISSYVKCGGFSLSNSLLGGYANNTDNWARLATGLDLTGRRDCAASAWVDASLPGFDPAQPVESQDRIVAETSPDGATWDHRPSPLIGSTSGFERWIVDLSELEGRSTGGLRFHLLTNASGTGNGIALDDLEIFCVPPVESYTGADDEFAFDFGTSMAAPHVAGTAVLMLSLDPGLNAAELKRRLLGSVDAEPALSGKTVTGGRLNAARALDPPPAPPAPPAAEGPPAAETPPPAGNGPPTTTPEQHPGGGAEDRPPLPRPHALVRQPPCCAPQRRHPRHAPARLPPRAASPSP